MIAMAKAVYYPKGERQKTIIKLLNSLEGRYSRWDIWQDFIVLSAVSIANAFGGPYREQREAMYLERSKKYSTSELEVLAQMLAEVVDEMEQNPDQDMLGELFMALGLANEWKGQFFTPYDICRAMAAMYQGEDRKSQIEEKGWVSVSDPACGAGALLLAFANECKRNHINYQTSVFFVAQDIDFLAGCMCYIQMSLLGCPGYVVIDDSILHPAQSYDEDGAINEHFEVGQQYYALVSKEVLVVSEVLQPGMYPSGSGGYHTLRSPMVRFRSEKTGLVHTCSLELAKHLLLAKRQTAKEKGVG